MGNSSAKSSFAGILQRLTTQDLEAADQDFWDLLWKTPLTVEVTAAAAAVIIYFVTVTDWWSRHCRKCLLS